MKFTKNTLKNQIIILIGIMFFVLVSLFYYIGSYLISVTQNNITQSSAKIVALYMEDVQGKLDALNLELKDICANIYDLDKLRIEDGIDLFMVKSEIYEMLKNKIRIKKDADSIYVIAEKHNIFLNYSSSKINTSEVLNLTEYMKSKEYYVSSWTSNKWSVINVEGEYYFFLSKVVNDITVAIIPKVSTIFDSTIRSDTGDTLVLTDLSGELIYNLSVNDITDFSFPLENTVSAINSNQHWIVTEQSDICDMRLSSIIPKSSLSIIWKGKQLMIGFFLLFAIAFLILILRYIQKRIVLPVNNLVKSMQIVQGGDLNHQVNDEKAVGEFVVLNDSFNIMVKEISNLKIIEYENKIELQEEKLKHLLTQIRPHFYINAISTIYSMTYQQKDAEIRKFITALSKHLRYVANDRLHNVSLNDELEHIKNYIEMQQIRFPDKIFLLVDTEHHINLDEIMIPHMLLHTIIENSFKYALNPSEMLTLMIRIDTWSNREFSGILILIEDNGSGFSEDVLELYNSSKAEVKNNAIGLSNVKRTLELEYGREDLFQISNSIPHGARIEMKIPVN